MYVSDLPLYRFTVYAPSHSGQRQRKQRVKKHNSWMKNFKIFIPQHMLQQTGQETDTVLYETKYIYIKIIES